MMIGISTGFGLVALLMTIFKLKSRIKYLEDTMWGMQIYIEMCIRDRSYDGTGMVCDSFYCSGYIKNYSGIWIVKKAEKICAVRRKKKLCLMGKNKR